MPLHGTAFPSQLYFDREMAMNSEVTFSCRRHNHVHAAYVNAALTVFEHVDMRHAEDMLQRAGVPTAVISRVLLQEGAHRARSSPLPGEPNVESS